MVSSSTRRLPSTVIDAVVWATADDETTAAHSVAATGMAIMIRAATRPPRNTRSPTFMRNAPLSFHSRSALLRTDRFPFIALLVDNFAQLANGLSQCNFNFMPRRGPSATNRKSFSARAPDGRHYRRRKPLTSAPKRGRHGSRIPGTAPTAGALSGPPRHRTKDDRHRAAAPETGSANRWKPKAPRPGGSAASDPASPPDRRSGRFESVRRSGPDWRAR